MCVYVCVCVFDFFFLGLLAILFLSLVAPQEIFHRFSPLLMFYTAILNAIQVFFYRSSFSVALFPFSSSSSLLCGSMLSHFNKLTRAFFFYCLPVALLKFCKFVLFFFFFVCVLMVFFLEESAQKLTSHELLHAARLNDKITLRHALEYRIKKLLIFL